MKDHVRIRLLICLASLKPSFDHVTGTVTAGNSSQITDGAAAALLMTESKAKTLGLQPLGYIRDYAVAGLQPSHMGLGPVFAISKLLTRTGMQLSDFELIEINEAFAAQVLAVFERWHPTIFSQRARPRACSWRNRHAEVECQWRCYRPWTSIRSIRHALSHYPSKRT